MSNNRADYHKAYDKANTVGVYIKLNKKTDADIIEALKDVNKQGYIKALIRRDLKYAATLDCDLIQSLTALRRFEL